MLQSHSHFFHIKWICVARKISISPLDLGSGKTSFTNQVIRHSQYGILGQLSIVLVSVNIHYLSWNVHYHCISNVEKVDKLSYLMGLVNNIIKIGYNTLDSMTSLVISSFFLKTRDEVNEDKTVHDSVAVQYCYEMRINSLKFTK